VLDLGGDQEVRARQAEAGERPADIGLVAIDLGGIEGPVAGFGRRRDGGVEPVAGSGNVPKPR
jgi:hypothetical protein